MNKRLLAGGLSGNVLEWYDFAVYGYFAAVIGKQFFPTDDSSISLILSLGVFAIGFLARPAGSIIFGHLGDRIGRKRVLVWSTMMMAIPCTMVGLLPTYDTIGYAAPFLLIAMRLLQGASVGGEFTGSVTYLSEQASPGKKYFYASFTSAGALIGVLLGSALAALINLTLTAEQLADWGWRVPFLLGSLVGVTSMLTRRQMPDDNVVANSGEEESPILVAIKQHWKLMAICSGIAIFSAINFYMVFVYLATYMVDVSGMSKAMSLEVNTISMIVLVPLILCGGYLGDRIGAVKVMLASVIAMIALAYPLFWMIGHDSVALALTGQIGLACIIGPYLGVCSTYMGSLYDRDIRMSGLSVSYNISLALFGGTAPMVAHLLIADIGPLSTAGYACFAAIVSGTCILLAERMRTQ
ncbi:MAG: MFS transporter [Hyphomicrobiaceae bacterium]